MSTDEIAREMGLHANTVRAHLEVLVREGKASSSTEQRATRGRPRELFTTTGAPEPEESYASLAAALAAQLESLGVDAGAQAVEAGKRWAAWEQKPAAESLPGVTAAQSSPSDTSPPLPSASPTDEVLAVLRRTGFAPEVAADGATILLHHCPFGELAGAHTDVVCGAHLGLIQGTLDRVSPGARAQLTPFVAPGLCRTHVTPAP
ncbi:MAG: transcriptional regulator [Actinomycetales bacterium]|nr:transcriptional regulator [Actinomycetales bacterium]